MSFKKIFSQEAEYALKHYKGYISNNNNQSEDYAIHKEFKRLKAITTERKNMDPFSAADFCKFPTKIWTQVPNWLSVFLSMNDIRSLEWLIFQFSIFHYIQIDDYRTVRGILIGVSLSVFAEFSGLSTITSYAVTTFQKHDTSFCPYKSSIALAIALILGSLTTAYLVDKFGRKVLILVSLLGSACGLLTASFYHHVNQRGYDSSSYDWVPMIALSWTIFIASAGIEPLFYVSTQVMKISNIQNSHWTQLSNSFIFNFRFAALKIFQRRFVTVFAKKPMKRWRHWPDSFFVFLFVQQVRTYGMAVICFSDNCVSFVSLKAYPILLESLDLHGCLIIYGTGCIFGAIFVLMVLKETRGKPLDDVSIDV